MFALSERDRTTDPPLATAGLSVCNCFRVDHQGVIAWRGSHYQRIANDFSRAGSASRIPLAISAWGFAHQPLERLTERRLGVITNAASNLMKLGVCGAQKLDSLAETVALKIAFGGLRRPAS
jgi:hypothetical protein